MSVPPGAPGPAGPPLRPSRSIRSRLLASFLLVALVPLAGLAAWSLRRSTVAMDRISRDALLDACSAATLEIEKTVGRAQLDLLYLGGLPALRTLLNAGAVPLPAAERRPVEEGFSALLAGEPVYAAASWVDEPGDEQLRVVRPRDSVQFVPPSQLRSLSLDPFFREGLRLAAGRVLVGPLLLADPAQPLAGASLRLLARLSDAGDRRRGALILELRLDLLLERLRLGGIADRILLVDPRGVYLEHPRPPDAPPGAPWRLDLAERFPVTAASLEATGPTLVGERDGVLAALHPLLGSGPGSAWHLATLRPASALERPLRSARLAVLAAFAGAALLAALLAVFTAERLGRPLLDLARAAAALGRGEFGRTVAVRTGDEIEVLARAMEAMAGELEGLYRGLEERIRDKTTEIRLAHDRLQAAYDELAATHRRLQESEAELIQAEKLSSVGRLAASVAHEINNPAGIVSMYAQLLREDARDPVSRSHLDLIIESAEKVSRIVRALLDFSRRSPLQPERVGIAEAVAAARAELRARSPDLAVEVLVDVEPGLATSGDPAQIAQVFRNLLENAAHAMAGRGTVAVRARAQAGALVVEVDDSGPGIPDEVRGRIFEPFFSTKKGGAGTGLGLFVCYGIVRAHGGSLRAENRPEGGARFVIELPEHPGSGSAHGPVRF